MTTPIVEQGMVLDQLHVYATEDLIKLWDQSSDLSPADFRAMMGDALPEIVAPYEATASELATVWYDDLAPELPYKATQAPLSTSERYAKSMAWALNADGRGAIMRAAGTIQRAIRDGARRTTLLNVSLEQTATWRRTASLGACHFCRMLVGRGGAYGADTVNFKSHDNCRCMAAVARRAGEDLAMPQYALDWKQQYKDARKLSDGSQKSILHHMRELHGPVPGALPR